MSYNKSVKIDKISIKKITIQNNLQKSKSIN